MTEPLVAGTWLRIEYADHNDDFAAELPRDVTVVRKVSTDAGVDDWYLVRADEPMRSEGREYTYLLVRSRWIDRAIGGPQPTSVFVLLVADPSDVPIEALDPHAFLHIAWGMASLIPAPD